jgi:hypothetical protein
MEKAFLDYLNSIQNIQFAMETETWSHKLLDITTCRGPDGYFGPTVHRMLNHANLYLNEKSQHCLAKEWPLLSPSTPFKEPFLRTDTVWSRCQGLNQPQQHASPPNMDSTSLAFLPFIQNTHNHTSWVPFKHNTKQPSSDKICQLPSSHGGQHRVHNTCGS